MEPYDASSRESSGCSACFNLKKTLGIRLRPRSFYGNCPNTVLLGPRSNVCFSLKKMEEKEKKGKERTRKSVQREGFRGLANPVQCVRSVLDPRVSAFSLSLYRHPFLYTLFSSRFTLIINNKARCTFPN